MFNMLKQRLGFKPSYTKLTDFDSQAAVDSKGMGNVKKVPTPELYIKNRSEYSTAGDLLAHSCYCNNLSEVEAVIRNDGESFSEEELLCAIHNGICAYTEGSASDLCTVSTVSASNEIVIILCDKLQKKNFNYIRDNGNGFLLHYAVRHNRCEIVRLLIGFGIGIDSINPDDGCTPLHYACKIRDIEIDIMLALTEGNKHKASLNIQDDRGDTPAHCAIRVGNIAGYEAFLRGTKKGLKNYSGISISDELKLNS